MKTKLVIHFGCEKTKREPKGNPGISRILGRSCRTGTLQSGLTATQADPGRRSGGVLLIQLNIPNKTGRNRRK